jgi:hypothetical protein
MLCRFFCFSLIIFAALGCSRDDTASARTRNGAHAADDGVAPRPTVITPAGQPYRVVAVAGGGTITGTVDIEGTAPAAPIIRPTVDQGVCGSSIVDKSIKLSGTRIGGAIVWLTDIRSGKAFPLERRFELNNANCTLDPYVQAIATGGTLNVGNDDRLVHTNRFINVGTGKILGVAPFNDDGELVPVDRFTEPAEIEVVSDKHPWTRAWIAVLDHPYFAQTAANGTFTIDAIPAGRYKVRAWHPAIGFSDDSVTVLAGQQVTTALRIRPTVKPIAVPQRPLTDSERAAAAIPILPTMPAATTTPSSSSTPKTIGPPPG